MANHDNIPPRRQEIPGAKHSLRPAVTPWLYPLSAQLYASLDLAQLQALEPETPHYRVMKSLEELLDRDAQREKDGFKRKINLGKIAKPGKGGKQKIIIVPTTSEEKLYHDSRSSDDENEQNNQGESQDTGESTGVAEGDEGDIIGERPLDSEQGEGEGTGAGSGEGGNHEVGQSAYELGRILTEKFKLPNLKEKGRKKSLTRFIYELTDRNHGTGQILDKKQTLKEIIKTNIALERINPEQPLNPADFLLNKRDYVYQVMSREKDVESQAVVFFVRDYSGSMYGRPTELVCAQHVMIYSWLMYQYKEQVDTRFILHDTEAREVKDFYTYHNTNVAGGTQISTAFSLVNKIVKEENLAKDNNIYVFYGSDGDDMNTNRGEFERIFDEMFTYVNRLGISIVQSTYAGSRGTVFENFLTGAKILEKHPNLAKLDTLTEEADDPRLIEGIRKLVS